MWVLPVPLLPTAIALHGREPRLLDPTLHYAPLAVDQLQFGQAQQKADMIEAFGGALPSELVVLAQERRQLERLLSTGRGISPVLGLQFSPLWRGW